MGAGEHLERVGSNRKALWQSWHLQLLWSGPKALYVEGQGHGW